MKKIAHDWTVLLVDDEPDNIGVAKTVLDFYGADVHVASNGIEAIDKLKTVNPTFILLDLSMPFMDGWTMFEEVRANPQTSQIPVIALTAHVMETERSRAKTMGFAGFITKPFDIARFMNDIQQCLHGGAV